MFKIPFGDIVATIDNFSSDERKFPVEYWRYENVDEYETSVTIQLPSGKTFVGLPSDKEYKFKKSTYTIKYIKTGKDKLTVVRKATLCKDDVLSTEYAGMKEFLNNIIKIESKYIAFK
jgi:hypothetical protein